MANELVEKKENTVAVIEGHELGDIIKPLIKEIHLFDSYIAGTTHLDDKSVLDEIKADLTNATTDLGAISEELGASAQEVAASCQVVTTACTDTQASTEEMRAINEHMSTAIEFFKL